MERLNEKLKQSPVRFISFNYDRSLEYFMFNAIKNYYGVGSEETTAACNKIEICHVYGKLAPLEWESNVPNERLAFGEKLNDFVYNAEGKLCKCAANIKVIDEDRNDLEAIKNKCKTWIQQSDKVFILGFGFLDSNCKLLGIDKCGQMPLDKFYYTTHGLSENKKHAS